MSKRMTTENQIPATLAEEIEIMVAVGGLSPAQESTFKRAADRIEELEADNRLLRDAVYIDDLTVSLQADDRSKAMAAMKRALDFLNADMPTEAKAALRSTIAELTGGNDE